MYCACFSLAAFIARGAPLPLAARAASAAGSATVRHNPGFSQRRAPSTPASVSCDRPATGFDSVQAIGRPDSTEAISGSRNVVSNWWRAIHRQLPGSRLTIDGRSTNTGSEFRNSTLAGVASFNCRPRGSSARENSSVSAPAAASISGAHSQGWPTKGMRSCRKQSPSNAASCGGRSSRGSAVVLTSRPCSIQERTTGSSSARRKSASACARTARISRPSCSTRKASGSRNDRGLETVARQRGGSSAGCSPLSSAVGAGRRENIDRTL